MNCAACEVGWSAGGPNCWMCGQPHEQRMKHLFKALHLLWAHGGVEPPSILHKSILPFWYAVDGCGSCRLAREADDRLSNVELSTSTQRKGAA